jgi:cobalt-zinc-cadmium efflux system protein
MLVLIGFIVREALERIGAPREIAAAPSSASAVDRPPHQSDRRLDPASRRATLNTRAALLHVLGDALGSVAAITAGIVIVTTGWTPIDPLLSLLVAALILVSALRLLREVMHVLMEGVPLTIQLDAVGQDLAKLDGVLRVHDLHIWTLSSGSIALSAHLEIRNLARLAGILAAARKPWTRATASATSPCSPKRCWPSSAYLP